MTLNEKINNMAIERVKSLFASRQLQHIDRDLLDIVDEVGIDHEFELEEMQEEIFQNGLLSPLSVVGPYPNGRYTIIDGARRLNAMGFLGECKIPCYVIECDNLSQKDVTMLALSCNMVKRNDISLKMAYTEICCLDAAAGKIKVSQIPEILSNATGMSERQARKYRKIAMDGSEDVITAFENGEISINDAETIVRHPVEEQPELVEKYKGLKYGEKARAIIEDGGYAGYVPDNDTLNKKVARVIVDTEDKECIEEQISLTMEQVISEKIKQLIDLSNELMSLDISKIKDNKEYEQLLKATKTLLKNIL